MNNKRYSSGKEFIDYIKSLPDLEITDKKVSEDFADRLYDKIALEIERIDNNRDKSAGRAFTKVVY